MSAPAIAHDTIQASHLDTLLNQHSFIELSARERAFALLDSGSARELIGPFDRIKSPWLAQQGVVTQADDGVIIAKGTFNDKACVVLAIEGAFQGGSLGEVGGAKIAGALELAANDNRNGIPTCAIILFETGGVRLQEANLGLAAIADIHAAIVDLRRYQPVIGISAGTVGCFGGMSIAAALCSYLIVTQDARIGLNGPAVIEQEAGIAEYDSRDRPFIWRFTGGEQRYAAGLVDVLAEDDVAQIKQAASDLLAQKLPPLRSDQIDHYFNALQQVDAETQVTQSMAQQIYKVAQSALKVAENNNDKNAGNLAPATPSRGRTWFNALINASDTPAQIATSYSDALWVANAHLNGQAVRYIAVTPNPNNRFVRARTGEVGLIEGWEIAKAVEQQCEQDKNSAVKTPIIAIVDVASQAYGRREEAYGIHLALAAAAGAYAKARLAGHAVIALIVGKAMSGAFLAHGYQANRIVALDDKEAMVHAMGKASAARITLRSIEALEKLAASIAPMAYDIQSYQKLGLLWQLLTVQQADAPTDVDVAHVKQTLVAALDDIAKDKAPNLASRLGAPARQSSSLVRQLLTQQWH